MTKNNKIKAERYFAQSRFRCLRLRPRCRGHRHHHCSLFTINFASQNVFYILQTDMCSAVVIMQYICIFRLRYVFDLLLHAFDSIRERVKDARHFHVQETHALFAQLNLNRISKRKKKNFIRCTNTKFEFRFNWIALNTRRQIHTNVSFRFVQIESNRIHTIYLLLYYIFIAVYEFCLMNIKSNRKQFVNHRNHIKMNRLNCVLVKYDTYTQAHNVERLSFNCWILNDVIVLLHSYKTLKCYSRFQWHRKTK